MANKQVTVELPEEAVKALETYAAANGLSPADALVKAIATLAFIESETSQGGEMLIDKGGEFRRMRSK